VQIGVFQEVADIFSVVRILSNFEEFIYNGVIVRFAVQAGP